MRRRASHGAFHRCAGTSARAEGGAASTANAGAGRSALPVPLPSVPAAGTRRGALHAAESRAAGRGVGRCLSETETKCNETKTERCKTQVLGASSYFLPKYDARAAAAAVEGFRCALPPTRPPAPRRVAALRRQRLAATPAARTLPPRTPAGGEISRSHRHSPVTLRWPELSKRERDAALRSVAGNKSRRLRRRRFPGKSSGSARRPAREVPGSQRTRRRRRRRVMEGSSSRPWWRRLRRRRLRMGRGSGIGAGEKALMRAPDSRKARTPPQLASDAPTALRRCAARVVSGVEASAAAATLQAHVRNSCLLR